jgi:hypothetical protein
MVPKGALISIIQKGLHFTEAEFFAALASTAGDPNDARVYESCLGTTGLLEAGLLSSLNANFIKSSVTRCGKDENTREKGDRRVRTRCMC